MYSGDEKYNINVSMPRTAEMGSDPFCGRPWHIFGVYYNVENDLVLMDFSEKDALKDTLTNARRVFKIVTVTLIKSFNKKTKVILALPPGPPPTFPPQKTKPAPSDDETESTGLLLGYLAIEDMCRIDRCFFSKVKRIIRDIKIGDRKAIFNRYPNALDFGVGKIVCDGKAWLYICLNNLPNSGGYSDFMNLMHYPTIYLDDALYFNLNRVEGSYCWNGSTLLTDRVVHQRITDTTLGGAKNHILSATNHITYIEKAYFNEYAFEDTWSALIYSGTADKYIPMRWSHLLFVGQEKANRNFVPKLETGVATNWKNSIGSTDNGNTKGFTCGGSYGNSKGFVRNRHKVGLKSYKVSGFSTSLAHANLLCQDNDVSLSDLIVWLDPKHKKVDFGYIDQTSLVGSMFCEPIHKIRGYNDMQWVGHKSYDCRRVDKPINLACVETLLETGIHFKANSFFGRGKQKRKVISVRRAFKESNSVATNAFLLESIDEMDQECFSRFFFNGQSRYVPKGLDMQSGINCREIASQLCQIRYLKNPKEGI